MKLALQIPFGPNSAPTSVGNNPATNFPVASTKLGDVVNQFGQVAIYVGAFLMFLWALWGVFDYIKAEGNKESLAKARKKIQWAVVGFIILILAFFISDFLAPLVITNTGITPKPLTIN